MENVTSFIQKFATKPVHIQTIHSSIKSNKPIAEELFINRMTITEILDSYWSYDIAVSTLTTLSTL